MGRNSALPNVTKRRAAAEPVAPAPAVEQKPASPPEPGASPPPPPIEAVIVEGEPVPESAGDMALLGTPSLVTLKENTKGSAMKVRIIRACNTWVEDDEPTVNADYGKQLIANGLAEEVKAKAAPTGKAAAK